MYELWNRVIVESKSTNLIREHLYSHVRVVSGEIPAHKTREAPYRLI